MYALPILTTIANDAIRASFEAPRPRPARALRNPRPPRFRLALVALLERAAHAVAPAGYRPAQ